MHVSLCPGKLVALQAWWLPWGLFSLAQSRRQQSAQDRCAQVMPWVSPGAPPSLPHMLPREVRGASVTPRPWRGTDLSWRLPETVVQGRGCWEGTQTAPPPSSRPTVGKLVVPLHLRVLILTSSVQRTWESNTTKLDTVSAHKELNRSEGGLG